MSPGRASLSTRTPATNHARAALVVLPLLLAFGAAGPLRADEPAAAPATPAAPEIGGFSVSGYLDASLQHLDGTGEFSTGSPDRVFDAQHSGFRLHQASVTFSRLPKTGFGAVLNLVAGEDADVFAPYSFNPGAHAKIDFPQAYLQYATGALTIIAGRYVTLAGFETMDPRTDTNVSRSILYGYAIPFAHTGIRATVVANDRLTVTAGIVNGWDDLKDTNAAKTTELGLTWSPTKTLSLTADGYVGRERVGGLTDTGPEGERQLLDVIASWTVLEPLTLVLNYDIGRQDHGAAQGAAARWRGLAGYLNLALGEHWRTSVRAEVLDDPDGYRTSLPQRWREATITLAWAPMGAVELRLEGRRDRSDHAAFVTTASYFDNPPQPAYLSRDEASVALEGLYKF